ncbi:hypothetical protein ACLLO4_06400 [Kutzneria viridogrisea]|uniref:hypothetical protein n=1 Tax=Kutzneria TaxID=43356 RepID=UPI00046D284C
MTRVSASRKRAAVLGSAAVLGVAAVVGGGFAVVSGTSQAATENCQGLDTALQNNLNFIADQQAHPDAQSKARIANRQAVIDQIDQRRKAAGCTRDVTAGPNSETGQATENCQGLRTALDNNEKFIADQLAHPDSQSAARIANRRQVVSLIQQRLDAAGCGLSEDPAGDGGGAPAPADPPAKPTAAPPATNAPAGNGVVCKGSTVTLSGEGGAPAAASNQFPQGTKLKVTNLDNNKSTTVTVTSVSGSCVLLNTAAFEQVREQGKFLIRRAVIEKVG